MVFTDHIAHQCAELNKYVDKGLAAAVARGEIKRGHSRSEHIARAFFTAPPPLPLQVISEGHTYLMMRPRLQFAPTNCVT